MYTERFQKHNKNEFLCLPDDVIALTTSSCTKNCIFAKNVLDDACSNKGVADIVGPMAPEANL